MLQFELIGNNSGEKILLQDAELVFWPQLFQADESKLFKQLMETSDWQSETIRIAGVERLVPRLTAWYGDNGADYYYSGVKHQPMAWTKPLLLIKEKIEQSCGESFNSALCNLYRSGQDSVAWHADDEPELGQNPIIASASFGATRTFQLKHKKLLKLRHKMSLTSGSLLIMKGATQACWQHQVPKEPTVTEPRINITFRNIKRI